MDGEDEWIDLVDESAGSLGCEAVSNPAANERPLLLPPQSLEEKPGPATAATLRQGLREKRTQSMERE